MKQPQGSSQSAQQSILSLFTGLTFAAAIAATLLALVALHDRTHFQDFLNATFISLLAGFVVTIKAAWLALWLMSARRRSAKRQE